jgi:hypothetical protein
VRRRHWESLAQVGAPSVKGFTIGIQLGLRHPPDSFLLAHCEHVSARLSRGPVESCLHPRTLADHGGMNKPTRIDGQIWLTTESSNELPEAATQLLNRLRGSSEADADE